ncbi:MAG: hypothetical protein MZV63_14890 [Marinilabiliales bacterium]|nr:hypothetical protein [Marinilabiliales bacterium]
MTERRTTGGNISGAEQKTPIYHRHARGDRPGRLAGQSVQCDDATNQRHGEHQRGDGRMDLHAQRRLQRQRQLHRHGNRRPGLHQHPGHQRHRHPGGGHRQRHSHDSGRHPAGDCRLKPPEQRQLRGRRPVVTAVGDAVNGTVSLGRGHRHLHPDGQLRGSGQLHLHGDQRRRDRNGHRHRSGKSIACSCSRCLVARNNNRIQPQTRRPAAGRR